MKQNAKICAIGEQNVIIEVFIILEELIRRERRDGGEGEERRLRRERERERIEIERKETNGN